MKNQELVVALSTCPDTDTASRLARELVQTGLAACVNVVPGLSSFYIWNETLRSDEEVLMVIKTSREALPSLEESLVSLHPYEVPELIALPVVDGHDAYLRWLAAAVSRPAPGLDPK
jgi:periplasmic divalent cation tolerance protein